MARYTTTRARVRELAEKLSASGIEPTSTLILARLGMGSPNTVVDELKQWRAARLSPPPTPKDTAPLLPDLQAKALSSSDVATLTQLLSSLAPFADTISRASGDMGQLSSQVAELNGAIQRLDGIRLLALKQIDEARGQARYWEEEARRLKTESTDREHAYRLGMNAARSDADAAKGQVEELRRMVATLQLDLRSAMRAAPTPVATLQLGGTRREDGPVATLQLEAPTLPHLGSPSVATLQVASAEGPAEGSAPALRSYDPDGMSE